MAKLKKSQPPAPASDDQWQVALMLNEINLKETLSEEDVKALLAAGSDGRING